MLKIKRIIPAIVLLAVAACTDIGPTGGSDLARSGLEEVEQDDAQDDAAKRGQGRVPLEQQ